MANRRGCCSCPVVFNAYDERCNRCYYNPDYRSHTPLQVALDDFNFCLSSFAEFDRAVSCFSEMNCEVLQSSLISYLDAGDFACPEDLLSAIIGLLVIKVRRGDMYLKLEFDPLKNGRALDLLCFPFIESSKEVSSDD